MTNATINECFIDRRCPERESRRKNDCFQSSGAMIIFIGFTTLLGFAIGLAVGALIW